MAVLLTKGYFQFHFINLNKIPLFEAQKQAFPTLGIIKKQAFQSSVLIYAGTIIGFVTTGLLVPNLLSKGEIGTIRLLMSYSAIFMSLGVFGFGTVTIRFMPRFFDPGKKRYHGFLGLSMLMGFIGFLIACAVIYAIRPAIIQNNLDKSPQFAEFFFLIIPLTFFQVYYALFDAYNNALTRSSYGIFLRDFVQRIFLLIGILLLMFHFFDFRLYLYYYVSAVCLPSILILIHIIRHNAFDVFINFDFLKKPLVSSMASVGLFGLLNTFSFIAVMQIDSIMLNIYLDAATVGIYTITFYFGTLVLIPAKALNKITPTLIARAYKEKDLDTVKDIYYKSTANLFLIGTLILLGLCVNLENIFHIIPASYADGKYVIVLIGALNLVKMSGGSNDSIITFSSHYKTTTVLLVFLVLLIVIFNLIFIPMYGMAGAALASLFAVGCHNFAKFVFIKHKFGFNPYNFQYLLVLAFSGLIYLLISTLPEMQNFILEIMMDSVVTMFLFYLAIKYLPLAKEADTYIRQILSQIFRYIRPKIK